MRCWSKAQDNYSSQNAENARQLRSRLIEILNVPPKGTPPGSTRLRPCCTAILSILHLTMVFPQLAGTKGRAQCELDLLPAVAPVA